jgi:hypothetical protein
MGMGLRQNLILKIRFILCFALGRFVVSKIFEWGLVELVPPNERWQSVHLDEVRIASEQKKSLFGGRIKMRRAGKIENWKNKGFLQIATRWANKNAREAGEIKN